MRSPGRPGLVWALTLVAITAGGVRVLDSDRPAGAIVRPAFTIFVVDPEGRRQPVAHYDGLRWAPRCEAMPTAAAREADGPRAVLGIEGSSGAPLYPVRLLAGDPERWQRARDAVQVLTGGVADGPGRIREAAVYAPVGLPSDTVFVDLVLREAAPGWRGIAASAWVHLEGERAQIVAPRIASFDTYEAFVTTPRLHPLGLVDVGRAGERAWVMQDRSPALTALEVVRVSAEAAPVAARVTPAGC